MLQPLDSGEELSKLVHRWIQGNGGQASLIDASGSDNGRARVKMTATTREPDGKRGFKRGSSTGNSISNVPGPTFMPPMLMLCHVQPYRVWLQSCILACLL